jgi:hypothetical protein
LPATWRAVAIALDAATALCATLNLAYFLERLLTGRERAPRRRAAVLVLTLISFAALLEAAFLLSSAVSAAGPAFAAPQWTLVRAVGFVATACLSALVIRRLAGTEPP